MCDICRRVPKSSGKELTIKQRIAKTYKQCLGDYYKPTKEDKAEAMQMAEKYIRYGHDLEEDDRGYYADFVNEVECCGVREMPARHALCAEGFERIRTTVARGERFGFLFATTTQAQQKEAAALAARRFKKVGTFTNPNTSHVVTFWTFNIKPFSKKKEKENDSKRIAVRAA